ncbi:helix-turn-helix domain-containing protein [Microbacterium enclense]|uniref:helix-turn-helix domain-containing protein n=1 Tax=Microbacterium enclense TaxID=993073 RepID=UPI003D72B344
MATTPGIKLICTHDGCEHKSVARRLCCAHYQAAWKACEHGQHRPLPPREKAPTRCPADHKHANSSTCYIQHQCRCTPCGDAHAARERNRQRQKAYGRFDTGLVDAEPVRQHVLALAEYGIGYKRVAELAGVGVTGVRSLIWGRQDPGPRYGEIPKRVGREKAEKILAVQPAIENLGARQPVPAVGTHRRVQALVARGWSISHVGRVLGWEPGNFRAMLNREHVGAATHRDVAAIYERMWNVEPPRATHREKLVYSRSVSFAKRRGWLPPLAWDDIDTDPTPESDVVQQGRVTGEELLEDIAFLLDGGESPEQVALLVGRKPSTIAKLAQRNGEREIANAFGSLEKRAAA